MSTQRKFDKVSQHREDKNANRHESDYSAKATEARMAYVERHRAKETTNSDLPHRDGRTDK